MLELRQGPPRGLLRISATVGFGRKVVAPLLDSFVKAYPDIAIDLLLDDRPTDFASEQIDVAFRNGRIEDSSIIAKQLIPMQMALCAAPSYVARHGLPETLDDLAHHECINFRFSSGRIFEWEFKVDGIVRKFLPKARMTFNDADLVLHAVLEGWGIAQMAGYQIRDHVANNELGIALARHAPDDRGHYICYLSRQHLPTRIRVFIDFMTEQIRALGIDFMTNSTLKAPRRFQRPHRQLAWREQRHEHDGLDVRDRRDSALGVVRHAGVVRARLAAAVADRAGTFGGKPHLPPSRARLARAVSHARIRRGVPVHL